MSQYSGMNYEDGLARRLDQWDAERPPKPTGDLCCSCGRVLEAHTGEKRKCPPGESKWLAYAKAEAAFKLGIYYGNDGKYHHPECE